MGGGGGENKGVLRSPPPLPTNRGAYTKQIIALDFIGKLFLSLVIMKTFHEILFLLDSHDFEELFAIKKKFSQGKIFRGGGES